MVMMTRFILVVFVCFLGGCGSQPAAAAPQTPLANTSPLQENVRCNSETSQSVSP